MRTQVFAGSVEQCRFENHLPMLGLDCKHCRIVVLGQESLSRTTLSRTAFRVEFLSTIKISTRLSRSEIDPEIAPLVCCEVLFEGLP